MARRFMDVVGRTGVSGALSFRFRPFRRPGPVLVFGPADPARSRYAAPEPRFAGFPDAVVPVCTAPCGSSVALIPVPNSFGQGAGWPRCCLTWCRRFGLAWRAEAACPDHVTGLCLRSCNASVVVVAGLESAELPASSTLREERAKLRA